MLGAGTAACGEKEFCICLWVIPCQSTRHRSWASGSPWHLLNSLAPAEFPGQAQSPQQSLARLSISHHSLQAVGMWNRASLCQSVSKPEESPVSPFRPWCGSSQRGSWSSSLSIKNICICISWESLWGCPAEIHRAGYGCSRSHEKLGVPGSSPDPQPVLGQDLGFIPGGCSSCLLGETPVMQRPEAPSKSCPSCCVTPASGSFLRLSSGSFPAPRLFLEFFLSWFHVGSGCSGAPQAVNPSLSRPGRFLWHEWLWCVVLHGVPVVLYRDSSQQGQWEVWRGSRKLNGGEEGTTSWWKAIL